MGAFSHWRWLLTKAGFFGACLIFLLAPTAARAGCGSEIHIFRPSNNDQSLGDPLSFATNHLSDSPEHAPLPNNPKPCSGPGCSREPLVPIQAPGSPPTNYHEQWGSLSSALGELGQELSSFLPDEHTFHPLDRVSSIFHPPRSL